MVPSSPIVHALIGLTTWAVVLFALERWQRHGARTTSSEPGPFGVAEEAEEWLQTQNQPKEERPE